MVNQAGSIDVNVLMRRVQRLFQLDTSVFEEVRADRAATVPAVIVAAASMFLFGLGGWLWWLLQDYNYDTGEFLFKSVIVGGVFSLLLWLAAIAITYVLLHQVFTARVDLQELVRVMSMAAVPLSFGLLMFIWEIGFGIAVAAVAMAFGTAVVAVQRVTDADSGKVVASVGAGVLLWAVILTLFGSDDWLAPSVFVFAPTG
jgi:hypothetical protein